MSLFYKFIVSIIIFICSCSWVRIQNEKYYWNEVKGNINELLPTDLRERCFPDLDQLSLPEITYSVQKAPVFATYNKKTHAIVISPSHYSFLGHEIQHYFNHLSNYGQPVDWDCLDQLSSYQSQRIIELEEKTVRLEQQLFSTGMRKRR